MWALHTIDKLDEPLAHRMLAHPHESVRTWAIRLLGDRKEVSSVIADVLFNHAELDDSYLVTSQLASTAGRLPAEQALPIVHAIAKRNRFLEDPHIPLQVWWVIERHAVTEMDLILELFTGPDAWETPIIRDFLMERLMKRYAAEGDPESFAACSRILSRMPNDSEYRRMMQALDAGLKLIGHKRQPGLPSGSRFQDIATKQIDQSKPTNRLDAIPPQFAEFLADRWDEQTTDPLLIRLATRLGSREAHDRAVSLAVDVKFEEAVRFSMFEILGELADDSCITSLIPLIGSSEPQAIQQQVDPSDQQVLG